jgi:hypothetical protein
VAVGSTPAWARRAVATSSTTTDTVSRHRRITVMDASRDCFMAGRTPYRPGDGEARQRSRWGRGDAGVPSAEPETPRGFAHS